MRTRRHNPSLRGLVALSTCLSLLCFGTPAGAASVSGSSQITLNFQQTPTTGFISGQPLSLSLTLSTLFRTSGVAADQVDGIYAKQFTFVAATPQTLDLTALTDVFGASITAARARLIAIKVQWSTDNVPLLVGAAGANEWTGFMITGSKISVFPSSSVNDGWTIFVAPQTTGMPISGGSKLLKLDPQAAAGTVSIIIATCST